MKKIILITGATDGIGLETAKLLAAGGHTLLLHGRNPKKLGDTKELITAIEGAGPVETYTADLSHIEAVSALADEICQRGSGLDVLINNAGVYKTDQPINDDGLDVRFVVNTLAPYLLTKRLLPLMNASGRVLNVSSAAQSPVSLSALAGDTHLDHKDAYAQSKLAITMWSAYMADKRGDGPIMIAINPGSLLGSKMVRETYGIEGNDIGIGADILERAALSDEFSNANGKYYDNDNKQFAPPHPDASNTQKRGQLVQSIEAMLA